MSRRPPGKKFKVHGFVVEGMVVDVEIRITDRNKFYAEVDEEKYESETFANLQEMIQPRLEAIHKLVYDPMIDVDYTEEGGDRHTFYGNDGAQERQKIELSFKAGYVSRTAISTEEDRYVFHRWLRAEVDEAGEIGPLNKDRARYQSDRMSKDSVAALIPFTRERWEKLTAIARALAAVRDKIASVMKDGGAQLDAMPVANLLAAVPEAEPARKRRA